MKHRMMTPCVKCDDEDTPRDLREQEKMATIRQDRGTEETSKKKKESETVSAKQASISNLKSRGKSIPDRRTSFS